MWRSDADISVFTVSAAGELPGGQHRRVRRRAEIEWCDDLLLTFLRLLCLSQESHTMWATSPYWKESRD